MGHRAGRGIDGHGGGHSADVAWRLRWIVAARDQAANSVLARAASIGIKRSRHVSRLTIPLDMKAER
jgi:hypothetical protein